MASLFGKPSAGGASEDEPLDDFEDEDEMGGPEALVLDLEPMGPPEHIRMMAQDVVGDDDAKITALYELVKAVLAEGDMPEESGLPPLPDEELMG
jgi:hypothetical protein